MYFQQNKNSFLKEKTCIGSKSKYVKSEEKGLCKQKTLRLYYFILPIRQKIVNFKFSLFFTFFINWISEKIFQKF